MSVFVFFVVLLFVLAIGDLIVGVSNDAVNFLNSAVGSKAATRRLILLVAALGIVVGATFSSGMMEVARKGIFNPSLFTFEDIMILFLAVMLTDIVLLDLFNSLGLPTSTTVSIVFELLGASVALAAFKVFQASGSWGDVLAYVNTSQAIFIITGIFISVGVAFTVGAIVQAVTRLILTYDYTPRMKTLGLLWGAAALTILSDFLVIKGMKGASFIPPGFVETMNANILLVSAALFAFWFAVVGALKAAGVNYFRFIVLVGTFALAMAFAGNDLVNFIGVPVAGLDAFLQWADSGLAPSQLTMESLAEPVQTQTWILLLAGAVMAVTLWRSKKARTVTRTEVELARQEEGYERFEPNAIARGLVSIGASVGRLAKALTPAPVATWVARRFEQPKTRPDTEHPDALFDLVRASVNLTTASLLIAIATNMKLPLSTTYVSFMVAMGASMADGAWGSGTAEQRVSGVVTVIGGWLATALAAMTAAGTVALLIRLLGSWAVILVVGLAIAGLLLSARHHTRSESERQLKGATADLI